MTRIKIDNENEMKRGNRAQDTLKKCADEYLTCIACLMLGCFFFVHLCRLLDSRFRKVGVGSLQIENIQEADEGTYMCRAENHEDSVDASATIEIQGMSTSQNYGSTCLFPINFLTYTGHCMLDILTVALFQCVDIRHTPPHNKMVLGNVALAILQLWRMFFLNTFQSCS